MTTRDYWSELMAGNWKPISPPCFTGYHQFHDPLDEKGAGHGSFEVFYVQDDPNASDQFAGKGWYWWACFPGCSPDGEPNGPFPTAEGAYLDAIGD